MSKQDKELHFAGIVHASSYVDGGHGKQFLGAIVQCSDGKEWVVHYDEQSPFHVFSGRRVLVSGEPYEPRGQYLIGMHSSSVGHLRVSTMRLVDVTPNVEFVELGAEQHIAGRFELAGRDTGESMLSFVTEKGGTFLVANDPAGAAIGESVEVFAYPVQPSASAARPTEHYLWIISPYSAADLWKWRKRSKGPSRV